MSSTIGDHVELQRGTTYKSALLDEEGPILLGLGSIERDGGFRSDKLRTYGGPSAPKLLVYPGDLYVSLKDVTQSGDLLGSIARVPDNISVGRMTQDTVKLLFKSEISKSYFYWLLRTPQYRQHCRSHATGTTNLGLSREDFFSFEIPEMSFERGQIVDVLDGLEEKINLNTQTNQTLEQIAQAIFKSWFVDFDPVKAKIAVLETGGTAEQAELAAMSAISAKDETALKQLQAEQPAAYAELAQTAALFPAVMEESELGLAPKGWKVSKLASCTTELRRGISPKYVEDGGVSVINQKCIRNHTIDFTLARRHDSSKRKIEGREVEIGDVLVNSTGVGTLGRLSQVRYLDEVTVVDSHVTVVRADTSNLSKSFLAGLMIQNESFIEASGAGSTGQTELRKQVIEDIAFTHPPHELDHKFDVITSSINRQIAELEKQQSTLAHCRDSLLPKLLSGELIGE